MCDIELINKRRAKENDETNKIKSYATNSSTRQLHATLSQFVISTGADFNAFPSYLFNMVDQDCRGSNSYTVAALI